jgi:hypothetical protein
MTTEPETTAPDPDEYRKQLNAFWRSCAKADKLQIIVGEADVGWIDTDWVTFSQEIIVKPKPNDISGFETQGQTIESHLLSYNEITTAYVHLILTEAFTVVKPEANLPPAIPDY